MLSGRRSANPRRHFPQPNRPKRTNTMKRLLTLLTVVLSFVSAHAADKAARKNNEPLHVFIRGGKK